MHLSGLDTDFLLYKGQDGHKYVYEVSNSDWIQKRENIGKFFRAPWSCCGWASPPGWSADKSQRSFKRPPQPTNVTSLPEPLCQRYLLRANKEASILQRRTLIVEAENERFGHFSPLDSVSDDSREAAVRSGSGSNPRRRSTDQPGPSDLLHHDTGDGETFIYLNFTIVLNSQLCRSGTPSTLRRRRRSATRSRYSSSDNPARQSTRTPVKPSTNRWNQDNRNHPLWKSCLNLDCKKCKNSF